MAVLPKGIKTTSYKTKEGTVIKYQVRFQDKDPKTGKTFKTCKTFEELTPALEYLQKIKLNIGRYEVKELNDLQERIRESFLNPKFEIFMNQHFEYRFGNLDMNDELQRKRKSQIKSVYKTICDTQIVATSHIGKMAVASNYLFKNNVNARLGDFKLNEITPNIINTFINAKLKDGLKKISVATYLTMISNFFKELKYINEGLADLPNPVEKYDRKLLKNAVSRTAKVISESNIKLLEQELLKSTNKDCYYIFKLSLTTAMRRSEVIFLEWEQIHWGEIDDRYIDLYNTKTEDHRRVFLSIYAQEIIEELKAKTDKQIGRVFNTSINAFERVFRLCVLRLKLDGVVTFHMVRKTAITNLFKYSPNNSIILSELFGFKEPEKLQKYHQEEVYDNTEKSKMKMIGHKQGRTTIKHYLTFKPAK